MTAFSLPSLPDPFKIDPIESGEALSIRPPRKIREAATDSIIRSNRAATPAAVADQRATKRLSIAELNAMDMPTLIDRYKAQRYDDRGAVTRFFDMLDMPRNVILSTVFPAIRRRKESEGDIGTFGLGNVHVSDVLDELGVDNRVIRGVLGFVGDVALDPLTYLGPAGWGGKIVGTGGKAIELTAEGRRALNAAVKAAARGRPVEDAAAGNILRAFGFGEESLAASRASKSAADIERDIRAGIYGSQTTANKVGSAIGLDLQTRGSALADAFHATEETTRSVAARDFVKQYGRASAKGYQIGTGRVGAGTGRAAGSYIAHIPFTSYGLFVPGFTGEAAHAAAMLSQANAGFSKAVGPLGEDVGFFSEPIQQLKSFREEIPRIQSDIDVIVNHTIPEAEIQAEEVAAKMDELVQRRRDARSAYKDAHDEYLELKDKHSEMGEAAKMGDIAIGQDVQWTSQGVGQFASPMKVESFHLAPDNTLYAKLSGSDTMVKASELHAWGVASQADIDAAKQARDAANAERKRLRLEYRKAKEDVEAHRPAFESRHAARDIARSERDKLNDRYSEIMGPGGLRERAIQQGRNIVQAIDPHNSLGGVVEGLNASRQNNRLNNIADVLHQHKQMVSKIDDANTLLAENEGIIAAVEERNRILKALGPEMDDEVRQGLESARSQWDAEKGGLFDPMPELDENAVALAYAERGEEGAREVKSLHEKAMSEWERRNTFPEHDVRSALRAEALEKRIGAFEPSQQELLNWSPEKADEMESVAKLVQDEMALRLAQAEAIEGTILETAKNTENKDLAYIAKDLMGLGATVGGYSMFNSVRNVAKSVFGDTSTASQMFFGKYDAMTEMMRSMMGVGGGKGEADKMVRIMRAQAAKVRDAAAEAKASAIHKAVMAVLEKHKIDPGRFAEAERAMYPMLILKMDPEGKAWSLHNSELAQALQDAKDAGLSPAFDDLLRIAEDHADALRAMTDDELADGVLAGFRDKYLPGTLTREGQEALGSMERSVSPGVQTMNGQAPFNTPLKTTRATWQSARDGETKQFYLFKYEFAKSFLDEKNKITPYGMERLQTMAQDSAQKGGHAGAVGFSRGFWEKWNANPMSATAEDVSKLSQLEQEIVKAADYNMLPAHERLTSASFKMVDPITKNRDLTTEFSALNPGVLLPRGLYEESIAETMAKRAGAHEFATIRKQFNDIVSVWAQAVPKAAIEDTSRLAVGDIIPFTNGASGRVVKSGGDFMIEVGGERYRRLRNVSEVRESLERLGSGVYGSKDIDIVYPVHVAEALEKLAHIEKQPGAVLSLYDTFLRYWKGTTLAHFSWVVGDAIGGIFQMLMMGVSPAKAIARVKDGIRLAMAQDKEAVLRSIEGNFHGMNAVEFVNRSRTTPVLTGHAHGEPFQKLIDNGVYLPAYSQSLLSSEAAKNPIGAIRTRWSEMKQRSLLMSEIDSTNAIWSKIPRGQKISRAWRFMVDEGYMNHIAKPWWMLNGRVNDSLRMTALLALMDDGHDFAGAASKVLNGMFDIEDMTSVERTVFKRLIPFYAWMKHSGLYWTKRMLQQPALLSIAPRVKDAIEESLYGDNTVPEYLRPNWMRDQMALQIGSDSDSRYAFTLGTLLPTETATAIGAAASTPAIGWQGIQQLAGQVGFGLSVPFKLPIELGAGRELFSGREIGFNPDQGDLSVGEYLAGQIRPLREFGVGNIRQGPIQKAAQAGVVPLASRVALGGRSQPFDDERIRQNMLRQYKQDEQSIRKRITIAEREGNAEASGNARARLLRLYTEMIQKGVGDAVPAWARKQLEQVAGGM